MKDVNIYIYTEYTGSLKSGTGIYHVLLETTIEDTTGKTIPWTNTDVADPEQPRPDPIIHCEKNTTRNRLELLALNEALSHMKKPSRITVYTSSDYITGAFMQDWPENWEKNGFRKKGKPIKHADLWKSIMEQIKKHDYTFIKSDKTSYTKTQAMELKNFKENGNMQREAVT